MEEPENTVIETPTTEPDLNETITQTNETEHSHTTQTKVLKQRKKLYIYWLGKILWLSANTSVVEDFGKQGVHMNYIWAIQDMYYGVTTSVSLRGKTNDFPLGIELHQGLALSL